MAVRIKFGSSEWKEIPECYREQNNTVMTSMDRALTTADTFPCLIDNPDSQEKLYFAIILYAKFYVHKNHQHIIGYVLQQGYSGARSTYALCNSHDDPSQSLFASTIRVAYTNLAELMKPSPVRDWFQKHLHNLEIPSTPADIADHVCPSEWDPHSGCTANTLSLEKRDLAQRLFSMYTAGFAPPAFSTSIDIWEKIDWNVETLFLTSGQRQEEEQVRRLVTEREPVNIEFNRSYNEEALFHQLGYKHGAYTGTTLPYVVIARPIIQNKSAKPLVCNAVGYGFDNYQQPDVQRFAHDPINTRTRSDVEIEHLTKRLGTSNYVLQKDKLLRAYTLTWYLILHAAERYTCTVVYSGALGGNNFSPWGSGKEAQFRQDIQEPAIAQAKVLGNFHHISVTAYPAFLPGVLDNKSIDMEHALWVNAWDQFSVVGNGNARDESLDGRWGRMSTLAVQTWPVINHLMKFTAVHVP